MQTKSIRFTVNLVLFALSVIVILLIIENASGDIEVRLAEMETRRIEAEKARMDAELDVLEARASLEQARGDRAILESAARSVDADRRLVTWYALRGDMRVMAIFIALLMTISLFVGLSAGMALAKKKFEEARNDAAL